VGPAALQRPEEEGGTHEGASANESNFHGGRMRGEDAGGGCGGEDAGGGWEGRMGGGWEGRMGGGMGGQNPGLRLQL